MTRIETWVLIGIQALTLAVLVGRLYYDRKRYWMDAQRRLWELGQEEVDRDRFGR